MVVVVGGAESGTIAPDITRLEGDVYVVCVLCCNSNGGVVGDCHITPTLAVEADSRQQMEDHIATYQPIPKSCPPKLNTATVKLPTP